MTNWKVEQVERGFYVMSSRGDGRTDVVVNVNVLRWLMNRYPKAVLKDDYAVNQVEISADRCTIHWKEGGGVREIEPARMMSADCSVPLIGGMIPRERNGTRFLWGGSVVNGLHRLAKARLEGKESLPIHSPIWPLALLATEFDSGVRPFFLKGHALGK